MYSMPMLASSKKMESSTATIVDGIKLISAFQIPMTLKAVVELGVFDVIAEAGKAATGCQLSAGEIVAKLRSSSTGNGGGGDVQAAVVMLERMLQYLASNSVLTCSVAAGEDGQVERRYGLAPVGEYFTKSGGNGEGGTVSLTPVLLLNLDPVFQVGWQELKHAVSTGEMPFQKAHGVTLFEYSRGHPSFSKVFNNGMTCLAAFLLEAVMDSYRGFQGLDTLVDVGGGSGATLQKIVSEFPHIKGINFDLPHVVSDALPIPGGAHVGGDMFDSVPSGDAIILKWILHNWSDEQCLKLLKNCYKALPNCGKVIVIESIIPLAPEIDSATQVKLAIDLCMLTNINTGKARSRDEFEFLAKEAGFSAFRVASQASFINVMEFLKE